MKLKSEMAIVASRSELLSEDVMRKEELLRQLQWKLDEERRERGKLL